MTYSKEELLQAKRQLDSTLHKLEEVVKTLETKENPARCKSQLTLAKRRIQAFAIARALIQRNARMTSKGPELLATKLRAFGFPNSA